MSIKNQEVWVVTVSDEVDGSVIQNSFDNIKYLYAGHIAENGHLIKTTNWDYFDNEDDANAEAISRLEKLKINIDIMIKELKQ